MISKLKKWLQHLLSQSKYKRVLTAGLVAILSLILLIRGQSQDKGESNLATAIVVKRSYPIEVRTVGELEAERSTSVSTTIRTDQPHLIAIINDGAYVNAGDLIAILDAAPFEKKIEELQGQIQETQGSILGLTQALEWEKEQASHEAKAATFELEAAQLELNKITHGDCPLEIARLHAAMQKAKVKYEELNNYSEDLIALEQQGFLNPVEIKQTQKILQEEQENYQNAKLQYDSFVEHVHPMQVKKAESSLNRMISKQEEAERSSKFKIGKAQTALLQAQQQLASQQRQLKEATYELSLTEIRAPTPGMVVLKDDYRSGQRRKPRIGDALIRNQTILDLPDMSSMSVKTKVREIDLFKIDIGKPVTIEVDAYPNLLLKGKVNFIGILAMADVIRPSEEKSFEVKVALDTTDSRLRPGMTARTIIHAGQVENTLSVPIHAVFEFDKKNYCFVEQRNGFTMRPVEIGMNNEQWVEVRSGLKENERVCLSMPPEEKRIKP